MNSSTPPALRPTTDEAESLGIARTHEALATADLILFVTEASRPLTHEDEALLGSLEGRPCIRVRNKTDLLPVPPDDPAALHTSALNGQGIEALRSAIATKIQQGPTPEAVS